MSKPTPPLEPRPRLRRRLRTPEERREPGPSLRYLIGLGLLPALVLVALGPWFVWAPSLLMLAAVALHVRDVTDFGKPSTFRAPLRRLRLWLRGESIASCPLCREEVGSDEGSSLRCGGCSVDYHSACHLELGGCATLGCSERPQAPVRAKLKSA